MKTITQAVEDILQQSPFLTEAVSEGILNYSALARKLKPELERTQMKSFTLGAIVMALKRLEKHTTSSRSKQQASAALKRMTMQSNLVQYAFKNSPTILKAQERLLQKGKADGNLTVTFASGTADTGIIVSEELEKELETLTEKETLIEKYRDLSSISLTFNDTIPEVPGVYYPFFQALAWNGINVVQIVSGFAELTFLFRSQDIDRAFSVLSALTKKKK